MITTIKKPKQSSLPKISIKKPKNLDNNLAPGQLRMLEVDNRLVLPVNKHIRLLTCAGDVIHSFAVPSLGVKLDAIPGRLNQTMVFIKRQGVFYGQCSELCGNSH